MGAALRKTAAPPIDVNEWESVKGEAERLLESYKLLLKEIAHIYHISSYTKVKRDMIWSQWLTIQAVVERIQPLDQGEWGQHIKDEFYTINRQYKNFRGLLLDPVDESGESLLEKGS
jgi:hypothetical protein